MITTLASLPLLEQQIQKNYHIFPKAQGGCKQKGTRLATPLSGTYILCSITFNTKQNGAYHMKKQEKLFQKMLPCPCVHIFFGGGALVPL